MFHKRKKSYKFEKLRNCFERTFKCRDIPIILELINPFRGRVNIFNTYIQMVGNKLLKTSDLTDMQLNRRLLSDSAGSFESLTSGNCFKTTQEAWHPLKCLDKSNDVFTYEQIIYITLLNNTLGTFQYFSE